MIPSGHFPLYTDLYQLTMAQGYFLNGKADDPAVFDYFFRNNPFDGGYVVFAGTGDVIPQICEMHFGDDILAYLASEGFAPEFLEYLRTFRFQGDIWSVPEGEIVFPREPTLRVHGRIIEAQLIETLLLNTLNFQSLIATKASRICHVAGPDRQVIDFGLRRSQGLGGMQASRGAAIGGCVATSNAYAGFCYGLTLSGTQAHSWIQSFDDELEAFRAYAEIYGDRTVLLVDTYNTLHSGVPNAIRIAHELRARGSRLKAIRLDSGDLAYLSKKARAQLDDAGLHDVKISASNSLDEHLVKSLIEQGACIDIFGVGTRLVTAQDDPALDGVYKLAHSAGKPRLKLSENISKTTFPGIKIVTRYTDEDGHFVGDGISLAEEPPVERIYHPFFPEKSTVTTSYGAHALMKPIVESGELKESLATINQASAYRAERFACLPMEHKRFHHPHVYKVGISEALMNLRKRLNTQARTWRTET